MVSISFNEGISPLMILQKIQEAFDAAIVMFKLCFNFGDKPEVGVVCGERREGVGRGEKII